MIERVRPWLVGHALPWLPIVVGPSLLFGPALIAGRALFWGTPLLQFVPWRSFAKQLIASGQLPLWNPAVGMGAPLLANYQSALLYPPNWVLLVLDVAWGQTLLAMLHLVWAAAGIALLGRRLGMGPFAQAVSGTAFGLSGYLVTRAGFLSINAASAWLPWIVLAVDSLATGKRGDLWSASAPQRSREQDFQFREAGLLAVALSMQWLAGHAQLAWYSLVFAAAWIVFRAFDRGGWTGALRSAGPFALAGALALMLAAAQLVPTLEYLSLSDRSAGLEPDFAMTYSFWPWRLTGLLAPDLFGHPRDGTYWGYGNYWEDAIYVGVLPVLLAIGALLRKQGHRIRWLLAGTAGLSLLLALGNNTPLFPFLFENVPSFSLFQAPTRWSLLLVFSLALLAGFGAEGWGAADGRRLYWLRLGTAGAGAVVVTAAIGTLLLAGTQPTFVPAIAAAGLLLLAAGALALVRGEQPTCRWRALAVGLLLADLVYAGRGANPTLPVDSFQPRPPAQVSELGTERLYMPSAVEQAVKFEQAFRFDDYQEHRDWAFVREAALPNSGMLDGLQSANNFDPIRPARYADWIERLEAESPSRRAELLRYMGVGWVADANADYQPLEGAQPAWMAVEARWADGRAAALAAVFSDSFDIGRQLILEGVPPEDRAGTGGQAADERGSGAPPADGSDTPGARASVQFERREAGRVDLNVRSESGGWLVLADTWYPGWNAYLDELAVESYPADSVFRATWVPPGTHDVSFRYEPVSIKSGLALSGLGLIALALMLRR